MIKISVIVCTYNRGDILSNCLQSLAAQTIDEKLYEVIVINNNSTDETQNIAEEFAEQQPNFRVVIETAQGLSHARNRGYKEANGAYIAYIDDDAKALPDWVERILIAFETVKPAPVAVGGQYHPWYEKPPPPWFSDELEIRTWGPDKGFLQPPRAQFGFSGSNMAFRKAVLQSYGGFSPDFGMEGVKLRLGEEAELFYRIYKENPLFWYDPDIIVLHFVPVRNMTIVYQLRRDYHGGVAIADIKSEYSYHATIKALLLVMYNICFLPFRILWWGKNRQRSCLMQLQSLAVSIGALKNNVNKSIKLVYRAGKFRVVDFRIKKLVRRSPLKVVIGASGIYQKGWLPTDTEHVNLLDKGSWSRYFNDETIDAILAEHVWEHLSQDEAVIAAKNCFTYLKKGGYVRVAVPDGFHPAPEYIDSVKPGGIGEGSDDHKILYNYEKLSGIFESTGFDVELLEWFDENGNFHKKNWHHREGLIRRSSRYDERNKDGKLNYTSIILDAWKR